MKQMINGWLIIDKPEGMSSAQVVGKVKRLFNVKKVGHGGTLDPLATGVLPIALGEATKALSYILDGTKAYRFEIKWGEARSTEDREGEITATSPHRPQRQEIEDVLPLFTGMIEQVPPAYSALKVNGKRAYTLAREGQDVILPPRKLEIYSLTLLDTSPHSAIFEVVCSKGTYVRSLARDIALHLGTCGHVISLRRTAAGPFHEKNAILLATFADIGHKTELINYVLPLQDALADILALEIEDIDGAKFRQGRTVFSSYTTEEKPVLILCRGVPLGFAKVSEGHIVPLRVFNIKME
ncbi:MAG: tRNA pseudouridine(55) synthase TruB [Alphaproteobacteria bacterium]|nr:tRNA pseudouridine(55) synthase TruB [Alphaproteobacteria bacterium]